MRQKKRRKCRACKRTHNSRCWRQYLFKKKLRAQGLSREEIKQAVYIEFHAKRMAEEAGD